jgi:RES domain-containing protein
MPPWRLIQRGGVYWRVIAPDWDDPRDTSYSKARGGRWNPPASFGVLYLNATLAVAAANARSYFRPDGILWEDLLPEALPDVVEFAVPNGPTVDVVTDDGVAASGFPPDYPFGVSRARCQPVGRAVYQADERGIACRSAAECDGPGSWVGEELALFDRGGLPDAGRRLRFEEWYAGA